MIIKKHGMALLRRLVKARLYEKLVKMSFDDLQEWHKKKSNKMTLRKAFLEIDEIKKVCPIKILEDNIILPSDSFSLVYQITYVEDKNNE